MNWKQRTWFMKRRLTILFLRATGLNKKFKVCGHRKGKDCKCFYMTDRIQGNMIIEAGVK